MYLFVFFDNMAKKFFCGCILFLMVMWAGGGAGCSDNDDSREGKLPEKTGKMTFEFSFGKDVLELADVEVTFVDVDGSLKKEVVKQLPWKKTVLFSLVPVTAGYTVKVTPKKDLELKKETYLISEGFKDEFYEIQGEGVVSMKTLKSGTSSLTVKKTEVLTMLEDLSEENIYIVDADFNCSEKE